MSGAASVSRLFIALIVTVLSTVSFADDSTPYMKEKGPYLERCELLQDWLARYRASGRSDDPDDVIDRFLNQSKGLDRLQEMSATLGLTAEQMTRCNDVFSNITSMVSRAQATWNATHAAQNKKLADAALVAHQNSPEYKRARSLGYDDVGEIGELKRHQDMDGEDKMKSMLFVVDEACGRYFEAIQYSAPYVVYKTDSEISRCGEPRRVAVLGTTDVSAGDFIDRFATYEYVGWKNIVAPNGFSIPTRVLKVR